MGEPICGNCIALREQVRRLEKELGLRLKDGQVGALMHRLRLTPAEARVVLSLYGANGKIVTHNRLLDNSGISSIESMKVLVYKIREKLGPPEMIQTSWGIGYGLTLIGMSRVMAAIEPPELMDPRGCLTDTTMEVE